VQWLRVRDIDHRRQAILLANSSTSASVTTTGPAAAFTSLCSRFISPKLCRPESAPAPRQRHNGHHYIGPPAKVCATSDIEYLMPFFLAPRR